MDANEVSTEAVVVFSCGDYGKKVSINIMETVLCEDEEGAKKSISEVDEESLPLVEINNKVSIEKTLNALVKAIICEDECEGTTFGKGLREGKHWK